MTDAIAQAIEALERIVAIDAKRKRGEHTDATQDRVIACGAIASKALAALRAMPRVTEDDDRSLPTYGQIPWKQLGRDVMDAIYASRKDYEFDESYYPGHQMAPQLNFNSLARIVDKYRYYAPAALSRSAQPGADGWHPMGNAPRDGDDILADDDRIDGGFMQVVYWEDGRWHVKDAGISYGEDFFTRWTRAAPSAPPSGAQVTREHLEGLLFDYGLGGELVGQKCADAILALIEGKRT